MPIYEFYCEKCHTVYSFFSRSINTTKIPACPKCDNSALTRRMSMFAVTGRASEEDDEDLPFDSEKMERAMQMLESEAGSINEDDPVQAARLMRKLGDMTGLEFGSGMQEALRRMEKGEDPEQIEAEMGDVLENEEPFFAPGGGLSRLRRKLPPKHDDTLYEL
ncbi:MAG: zinc ribbon domain-containing protein [Desulfobacteraceae bacterium]|nr:zinc ribbon domain-containing protein [Desulfobacteraceae bacterium]